MIASTAPSARFAESRASRNAPRLSRSRALVKSAIGPWRSIPMFAAAVNFSREVRERFERFLRAAERALEIVVLQRGPRPRGEVVDRCVVSCEGLGFEDQGLRVRERGGQVLLQDLLAPLPRLLREVDRRPGLL